VPTREESSNLPKGKKTAEDEKKNLKRHEKKKKGEEKRKEAATMKGWLRGVVDRALHEFHAHWAREIYHKNGTQIKGLFARIVKEKGRGG